jgi:hypothetical protein
MKIPDLGFTSLTTNILLEKTHQWPHTKTHSNMADSDKKVTTLHHFVSLRYQEEESDISFKLMYETYYCSSSKLLAEAQIKSAIFHQNNLVYFYTFTNSHIPVILQL